MSRKGLILEVHVQYQAADQFGGFRRLVAAEYVWREDPKVISQLVHESELPRASVP